MSGHFRKIARFPDRRKPRDPQRIEVVLLKLRKLWHLHPDMRFFQLVVYLQSQMENVPGGNPDDPFYVEEDVLSDLLDYVFEKDLEDRKQQQASREAALQELTRQAEDLGLYE